jgi:hypothetical protein
MEKLGAKTSAALPSVFKAFKRWTDQTGYYEANWAEAAQPLFEAKRNP